MAAESRIEPKTVDNNDSKSPVTGDENTLEDLATRLREVEGVGEDTAEFLARNWQNLLWALLGALLVAFVLNEFRNARRGKWEEASLRFSSVQELAENVGETDSDKQAQLANTLREQIKGLEDSYSGTVYGELAPIYSAILSIKEGKADQAKKQLEKDFSLKSLLQSKTATPRKKMSKELLTLDLALVTYFRALANTEGATFASLLPTAESILTHAQFVGGDVLAALSLYTTNEEETAKLKELANSLLEARPFLIEQLTAENLIDAPATSTALN